MIERLLRAFGGFLGKAPDDEKSPLRGMPAVRRLKSYQADTGFTWSYYYEGFRELASPVSGRAYEFALQNANTPPRRLAVVIPDSTCSTMAEQVGREIAARELYALAKMHLFSVLDRETVLEPDGRVMLDAARAMEFWNLLDL